jgi:hypothetical protein
VATGAASGWDTGLGGSSVRQDRLRELADEFRSVVLGQQNLLDTVIPTVVFLLVNALWGFTWAMWTSLVVAVTLTVVRLWRRQPLQYTIGGTVGVILAIALPSIAGRGEAYFLPSIVSGALATLAALGSVLVRRPLLAWTSHLARRWPRDWYWHPRVRPAYSEVTLAWGAIFTLRLWLQLTLFLRAEMDRFAALSVLGGWPTTVVLLVVSYLYGTWRLRRLGGPSVEEFQSGTAAPWKGQQRGF